MDPTRALSILQQVIRDTAQHTGTDLKKIEKLIQDIFTLLQKNRGEKPVNALQTIAKSTDKLITNYYSKNNLLKENGLKSQEEQKQEEQRHAMDEPTKPSSRIK